MKNQRKQYDILPVAHKTSSQTPAVDELKRYGLIHSGPGTFAHMMARNIRTVFVFQETADASSLPACVPAAACGVYSLIDVFVWQCQKNVPWTVPDDRHD